MTKKDGSNILMKYINWEEWWSAVEMVKCKKGWDVEREHQNTVPPEKNKSINWNKNIVSIWCSAPSWILLYGPPICERTGPRELGPRNYQELECQLRWTRFPSRWQTKALCREIKACFSDLGDLKGRLLRPVHQVATLGHWTFWMWFLRPGWGTQDSVTRVGNAAIPLEIPACRFNTTNQNPSLCWASTSIWDAWCSPLPKALVSHLKPPLLFSSWEDARLAWVQLLFLDYAPTYLPHPKPSTLMHSPDSLPRPPKRSPFQTDFYHWYYIEVMQCLWFSCYVVCNTCDPVDCSLPGSSVHGISQATILEWGAISFSRGSSQPRDRTWVSRTAGRFFTNWATRQAPCSVY